MRILLLILLIPVLSQAQPPGWEDNDTKSLVLRGDTIFFKNWTRSDSIPFLSMSKMKETVKDSVRMQTNLMVTGNIGFATGSGGTVVQLTNKTTAVTLNKISGRITMNGAALAAGAEVSFTVNNNLVAATDVPVVSVQSVGTAGSYLVSVGSVSSGAFTITVSNASAASLSQAVVLNYIIIKGAIN
jgi:hypothetical protein